MTVHVRRSLLPSRLLRTCTAWAVRTRTSASRLLLPSRFVMEAFGALVVEELRRRNADDGRGGDSEMEDAGARTWEAGMDGSAERGKDGL